jgi:uncharacterized membrane protein
MQHLIKFHFDNPVWIFGLILMLLYPNFEVLAQKQDNRGRPLKYAPCPYAFFENIGDLPGDCPSSLPQDISSDGVRIVLMSSADEPDVPNDGGACDPWVGWPHSNEAAGWTRPCSNIPFFTPPGHGTGGLIGLGYLESASPSHHESVAKGISPDGKIVVGYSNYKLDNNTKAVVFKKTGAVELALLDSGCIATDVCLHSAFQSFQSDAEMAGRIIIGYSNILNQYANRYPGARAVYWDDWDHVESLPYPPDSILPNGETIISSEAVSISDDGRIIAGNLYYNKPKSPQHHMSYPCVWIYHPVNPGESNYELLCVLDDLPGGDDCAWVSQVSGDGLVLVGTGSQAIANPGCWFNPVKAVKWTLTSTSWQDAAGSQPEALPNLPGFPSAGANGVNYNGSFIIGAASDASGPCGGETFSETPVLWNGNDPDNPPEDLSISLGPLIPAGWRLFEGTRVSANGQILTGYAMDADWNVLGWVAGRPVKAVPVSNWALLLAGIIITIVIGTRNLKLRS